MGDILNNLWSIIRKISQGFFWIFIPYINSYNFISSVIPTKNNLIIFQKFAIIIIENLRKEKKINGSIP